MNELRCPGRGAFCLSFDFRIVAEGPSDAFEYSNNGMWILYKISTRRLVLLRVRSVCVG